MPHFELHGQRTGIVALAATDPEKCLEGHPRYLGRVMKPLRFSNIGQLISDLRVKDTRQAQSVPETPEAIAASDAPITVLVAEDNNTNRIVVRNMLKNCGVDLHFAENGRFAVEMFEDLSPDLIFMDLSMPEVNGMQATQMIREREREAGSGRVPIVALTANAMEGDREQCLEAGMDDYLTKPIRKKLLLGMVDRFRVDAEVGESDHEDIELSSSPALMAR